MNSLKEVYGAMAAQDQEKIAEARAAEAGVEYVEVDAALLKQAQDYDHIGRVLAHHVFVDMVKQAVDESMPGASEEEKSEEAKKMYDKATGEGESEEEKKKKEEARRKAEEGEGEGEDEDEGESEKEAHVKQQILARMANDPEYVSHLVAKYYG